MTRNFRGILYFQKFLPKSISLFQRVAYWLIAQSLYPFLCQRMLVHLFKRNMASEYFELTVDMTVELKVFQIDGTRINFLEPNTSLTTASDRRIKYLVQEKDSSSVTIFLIKCLPRSIFNYHQIIDTHHKQQASTFSNNVNQMRQMFVAKQLRYHIQNKVGKMADTTNYQ